MHWQRSNPKTTHLNHTVRKCLISQIYNRICIYSHRSSSKPPILKNSPKESRFSIEISRSPRRRRWWWRNVASAVKFKIQTLKLTRTERFRIYERFIPPWLCFRWERWWNSTSLLLLPSFPPSLFGSYSVCQIRVENARQMRRAYI